MRTENRDGHGPYDYNLFLIGFMGCGKSTVAERLSGLLGMKRVEMDEMIAEEQGMAITEIFSRFGEERFRDLESAALIRLQQQGGAVISCGGGVVIRPENREHMRKNGRVVWLTAEPETVYERVKDCEDRPVLNGHMNVEYIGGLMEKRREMYQSAADLTVATDGRPAEAVCREIIRLLDEEI